MEGSLLGLVFHPLGSWPDTRDWDPYNRDLGTPGDTVHQLWSTMLLINSLVYLFPTNYQAMSPGATPALRGDMQVETGPAGCH